MVSFGAGLIISLGVGVDAEVSRGVWTGRRGLARAGGGWRGLWPGMAGGVVEFGCVYGPEVDRTSVNGVDPESRTDGCAVRRPRWPLRRCGPGPE